MKDLSIPSCRRAAILRKSALLAALALGLTGCGSSGGDPQGTTTGAVQPAADQLVFETAAFSVAPGQERYMCYTMKLDAGTSIDHFTYEAQPGVHHLVLVHTIVEEAAQPFECDVLFKQTWLPIFANGTGSADVTTPKGSGFKLDQGSQILVQLHLLNSGMQDLTGTARLVMHKNNDAGLMAAGIYGFGTQVVNLPPQQKTTITNDCSTDKDVHIFAGFPHMHKLGTSMTFWSGKDAASLTQRFNVDTWTFGEQKIYPMDLVIPMGDMTRVTCTYDNTTASAVTFGESTSNEMCYFTTFVAPYDKLDGCVTLQ